LALVEKRQFLKIDENCNHSIDLCSTFGHFFPKSGTADEAERKCRGREKKLHWVNFLVCAEKKLQIDAFFPSRVYERTPLWSPLLKMMKNKTVF
jgi:hypothetical protein